MERWDDVVLWIRTCDHSIVETDKSSVLWWPRIGLLLFVACLLKYVLIWFFQTTHITICSIYELSIFWIVFKQNGPFRAIFSSFQFRCQRELKIKFVFFSNRAIRLCCCPLLLRSSLDWMGKKFFEPEMSEWCFRQQLGWLPSYLLLVSLFHFPVFV